MACRVLGRGLFGFRPVLVGSEHLPRTSAGRPAGGWIAAVVPHRTWVDPFVVADLVPTAPRLVYFGDGRAMTRSAWRRSLVRWIGGFIPIWPGGRRVAVEGYIHDADQALAAGAVLVIFPEVGPPSPPGVARPLGLGLAYIALRTGAPIVPLVLGGTDELYRGRRLVLVVQAPVGARELAGLAARDPVPAPWSAAERRAAHAIAAAFHERTAGSVAAAEAAATSRPGGRGRWRWLTNAWH
jgi:1-acyl-sn-glycerol-3-phosphate acyltransferase